MIGLRGLLAAIALSFVSGQAGAAVDLASLWDFSEPEVSEQRFRDALATASGDDALILQTQIARTYGIRKDFARARELLKDIEPRINATGAEAQVRYWLELGRTYASATHPAQALTPENLELARSFYRRAWQIAQDAKLDALAVDAIHMFAFVDKAPADQLKWGRAALAVATSSTQPDARRWEASIRSNIGRALHQLGRYDEALEEFNRALALRQQGTNARSVFIAKWMVAWTLRSLKRTDEALQVQLALEREADGAGRPDPYVFEELEILYRASGDTVRAAHYAQRKKAAEAAK